MKLLKSLAALLVVVAPYSVSAASLQIESTKPFYSNTIAFNDIVFSDIRENPRVSDVWIGDFTFSSVVVKTIQEAASTSVMADLLPDGSLTPGNIQVRRNSGGFVPGDQVTLSFNTEPFTNPPFSGMYDSFAITLYAGGPNTLPTFTDVDEILTFFGNDTFSSAVFPDRGPFTLGGVNFMDQAVVTYITAPVPLPASALMLLAGAGALVVMRRGKTSQSG